MAVCFRGLRILEDSTGTIKWRRMGLVKLRFNCWYTFFTISDWTDG